MNSCGSRAWRSRTPTTSKTERRWRALQDKLGMQRAGKLAPLDDADRHGTVGAVAMDARGSLAAATSTGGITAKLPGRIGDSPLIGAGTWASEHCAVSATGDGEHFIRAAMAHEVCRPVSSTPASRSWKRPRQVIAEVGSHGGSGGLIATRCCRPPGHAVQCPRHVSRLHRQPGQGGRPRSIASSRDPLQHAA